MTWIFSKRCEKLLQKKSIEVHVSKKVRIRILKLLEQFDECYQDSTPTGFSYDTSILNELPEMLKAEHGIEKLYAYPEEGNGKAKPSNLNDLILRGNFPPYLFDILEIFFSQISNNEEKYQYQGNFNNIMEENNLPWRMADGKIFPIDSKYIEEEIIQRTYDLINQVNFQGALKEFEQARIDFTNRNYEGSIRNTSLSFESVIKEILGLEKAKPGELFRKLIDSGYIPEYYKDFLKDFEKNILRCVSIMRNEEKGVGHGVGFSKSIVPSELAELSINLTASLINYLIKCFINKEKLVEVHEKNHKEKMEETISEEDIPF